MRGLELDGRGRRLLVLTCATGMVDAVAFLGLGQVFCAMQTGNVVFLGLGVAGADGAPQVTAPLAALCAFVAGGVAAALLLRGGGGPARARGGGMGTAVVAEIALLALATALAAAVEPRPGEAGAVLTIAALAAAMGLRTTVVRGRGGANLATTVLNLTAIGGAVGMAGARGAPGASGSADLRGGSAAEGASGVRLASAADLAQRAVALVALLVGAVAGALLLVDALWLPLAVATSLTLATHALDRPAPAPA